MIKALADLISGVLLLCGLAAAVIWLIASAPLQFAAVALIWLAIYLYEGVTV